MYTPRPPAAPTSVLRVRAAGVNVDTPAPLIASVDGGTIELELDDRARAEARLADAIARGKLSITYLQC